LNAALISAATEGNLLFLKLCIQNGADIHCVSSNLSKTPLAWACTGGHMEIVEYLVNKGADIHRGRIDSGCSPLCYAAECGNLNILKFLSSQGAEINPTDVVPLYFASQNGHFDTVVFLVEN